MLHSFSPISCSVFVLDIDLNCEFQRVYKLFLFRSGWHVNDIFKQCHNNNGKNVFHDFVFFFCFFFVVFLEFFVEGNDKEASRRRKKRKKKNHKRHKRSHCLGETIETTKCTNKSEMKRNCEHAIAYGYCLILNGLLVGSSSVTLFFVLLLLLSLLLPWNLLVLFVRLLLSSIYHCLPFYQLCTCTSTIQTLIALFAPCARVCVYAFFFSSSATVKQFHFPCLFHWIDFGFLFCFAFCSRFMCVISVINDHFVFFHFCRKR